MKIKSKIETKTAKQKNQISFHCVSHVVLARFDGICHFYISRMALDAQIGMRGSLAFFSLPFASHSN